MAISTLVSAVIGNSAAKKAKKAQVKSAQMGIDLQRDIYGKNETNMRPYTQLGIPAGQAMNAMLGLGGDMAKANAGFGQWLDNSNYAFDLNRGFNQVNSGYAGNGTVQSGAAMKGIEDYRQNLQKGYRGEYMGLLGNQQGVGLSGASALAGVGQNFANSTSQLYGNQGDARANAALVQGQNTAGAAKAGINALMNIFGGGGF